MDNSNLFTYEQQKQAEELAKKAKDFLNSETAINYYAQKIHNGVGNHSESFRAGLISVRQDSHRFLD